MSSILVHMLCNYMGVPDITFTIPPGNLRESTRTSVLYEHRKGEEVLVRDTIATEEPVKGRKAFCCM